jgi:hypothetical protein
MCDHIGRSIDDGQLSEGLVMEDKHEEYNGSVGESPQHVKSKYTSFTETVVFGYVLRKDFVMIKVVLHLGLMLCLVPIIGDYFAIVISNKAWPPANVVWLAVFVFIFLSSLCDCACLLKRHPLMRLVGTCDPTELHELRKRWWEKETSPIPEWYVISDIWDNYNKLCNIFNGLNDSPTFKKICQEVENAEKSQDKECNKKNFTSQSSSLLSSKIE